jgi:predicted transcriptional regulator
MTIDRETLLTLTADIVAAHLANNHVSTGDVAGLIVNVHGALSRLDPAAEAPRPEKLKPAVSVRASIKPDYLVSLIDGKRYKALRRHLSTHGYTPDSYRAAFDLPRDYPMVSPNYSALRRALARRTALAAQAGLPLRPKPGYAVTKSPNR